MKNNTKFVKKWEKQRNNGKFQYVLKSAGAIVAYCLFGAIFGSVFLYSSPSSYSFTYYLPTYIAIVIGGILAGVPLSIYLWRKNEVIYSEMLDQ